MARTLLEQLRALRLQQQKWFAVLVDPDRVEEAEVRLTARLAEEAGANVFFLGGSLLVEDQIADCVRWLKTESDLPVVLFPGSLQQVHPSADGLLLLSLISGRNPELLIGQHVLAAPFLKKSGLEIIPTGYMLVDGGAPTTVSYISNTQPIPRDKPEIAQCTAIAGELLGLQMMYLDAGSGARHAVSGEMVQAVRQVIDCPIIVGGGIREPEKARLLTRWGADVIVVGNAIEKDKSLLRDMAEAVHLP